MTSPAAKPKRKAISKKLRFEVFKRDSFTCQYCGRKAPDVTLQVDHINPVTEGGGNDLLNLVTSCEGCNAGKGAGRLDDASVVEKRRRQLQQLQERREQIQMMADWHKSLLDLEEDSAMAVADLWEEITSNQYHLNDSGLSTAKRLISQFSLSEVLEALPVAAHTYFRREGDAITSESVNHAFNKLGGICYNRRRYREDPAAQEGDRAMWEFVGLYREKSHHPPNWRLMKWWKSAREEFPSMGAEECMGTILSTYRKGGFGSYWNAALFVWDDGVGENA